MVYCVVLGLWVGVEEGVRSARDEENGRGASGGGDGDGEVNGEEGNGEGVDGGKGKWNPMGLRADDVRIAMFFLFFVQVGFFGTGK